MKLEVIKKEKSELFIQASSDQTEFGLDLFWLETLDDLFSNLELDGISKVKFNFKNITWIDSSTLRQIAFHSDNLNKKGIELILLKVNSHVERVFKLTHMNQKITLEP